MTGHAPPAEGCTADAWILADLRELPAVNLGALAQPLVEARQGGDSSDHTRHALALLGEALSERKQREAA